MNKNLKLIIGVIGVIIVLAVGWYLVSPLFITNTVDEAFPVDLPTVEEAAEMTAAEIETAVVSIMDDIDALSEADKEQVETRINDLAEQMPDTTMNDAMPESNDPAILSQGTFVDADSFHQGEGAATIYTLADGSHVLRLEDFMVTNGPALRVILSTNPTPTNQSNIGEDYIDLGALKGNMGNQNYDIPADVDLSQVQSVVIYCQPFHVVFSTATLN